MRSPYPRPSSEGVNDRQTNGPTVQSLWHHSAMTHHHTFFKKINRKDTAPALALLEANPHWGTHPQSLLEAIHQSKPRLVKRVLELGGDPNVRSVNIPGAWRIPLSRAVQAHNNGQWTAEQRQIAHWLVEAGADINARSCFGMLTPLGLAAAAGNKDAVTWLLGLDAIVDLETACALGQLDRVRSALSDTPDCATTPRPSGRGQYYNVTLPIQGAAGSRLGAQDTDLAHRLAAIADALCDAGSPIGPWEHDGQTFACPAEDAAYAGNATVLKALLARGASAQSALPLGLQGGHAATLAVLEGDDLDLRGLIAEEARWGRLANALWLAERGAHPNERGPEGDTALHYAARRGAKSDWFARMVEHGADLNLLDVDGQTTLDIAVAKKKKKLARWLAEQ